MGHGSGSAYAADAGITKLYKEKQPVKEAPKPKYNPDSAIADHPQDLDTFWRQNPNFIWGPCVVAAVVYFVPQDLIFVGGLFTSWHAQAATISPCQKQSDAEGAVAAWKAKKGLENVDVYKGSRTWQVSMA